MERYVKTFKIKNKKTGEYLKADVELNLNKKTCIDYEDLKEKEMIVVSLSGNLYYGKGLGRPALMGIGQINIGLEMLINNHAWSIPEDFKRLLKIWNEYHLNDLQAGTKKQIDALMEKDPSLLKVDNYYEACEYLKEIGLFEDRGIKYGHVWLCKKISDEVIAQLKHIFNN